MRRAFLIGGLAATLLAIGAVALASTTRHYGGIVRPSGSVTFAAIVKHGEVTRIKGDDSPPRGITFSDIPATCNATEKAINVLLPFPIPVFNRKFRVSVPNQGEQGTTRVTGEFKDHYRRVAGTVRVEGTIAGKDCRTGRLEWHAARE